jgi:hypothetical protein
LIEVKLFLREPLTVVFTLAMPVSNALPLTYMLRLLQDSWLGLPWSAADTVVVLAFAAGAAVTSRFAFR